MKVFFFSFFSAFGLGGVPIFKHPLALLGEWSFREGWTALNTKQRSSDLAMRSNIILFTSLLFGGIKLSLFVGFNHGSATATTSSPGFTATTILCGSASGPTTLPSSPFCFISISLYQYLERESFKMNGNGL